MASTYKVVGILNRETVTEQLAGAQAALESGAREFDLSGVTELDSTALAFWLALERQGLERQIGPLSWVSIPEQMKSVAELVGLDKIIWG